jgi:hypothetical protein
LLELCTYSWLLGDLLSEIKLLVIILIISQRCLAIRDGVKSPKG